MRLHWWLAGIVLAGLGLRLWSITYGMPWAFNADEELHFVSITVRFFEESTFNPGYFENPPLLAYLFYGLFRLRFFGTDDFARAFDNDPEAAYMTARVFVALIGTGLILLIYWAGKRYGDRRVGLVAAALMAFCFLPVFYSHFALNDVVTMVPVTVALVGSLMAYEKGRWHDWLLAGGGAGVACATKYTAGLMAAVVIIAAIARVVEKRDSRGDLMKAAVFSGGAFVVVFLFLNPFSVLSFNSFREQLGGQSGQASNAKLGQTEVPGWLYYLWTLTWGLGVLPFISALGGGWAALRENRVRGLLLVALPVLLFLFLGSQGRFFARWFLPAYPAICILAGIGAVQAADWIRAKRPALGGSVALAGVIILLVAQGAIASIRSDSTLGNTDTRLLARDWLARNLDPGTRIVVEPFVPDRFLTTGGRRAPERFDRYPVKRPFQAYEKKLSPDLIDTYRAGGYCWVVTGSHQKERGLAADLAGAEAYYARLDRESDRTVVFSPYRADADPVGFNYDLSFNYLPREYLRPGPLIEAKHLRDCGP
ncbi:MAG: glycosyltransferase family 39 protein [Thermoleophilaceae bacterium]|nr:glycosyltransferase family 39 protein [Thermoleophilaceae bacterium]